MTFLLSTEQQDLGTVLLEFLSERSPLSSVRVSMDGEPGYDPQVWAGLAELGVLGLVVPEKFGGAGAGHVERSILGEALGRLLTPVPFFASAVLATDLLLAIDDDARSELLPAMAAGEIVATVAVAEGSVAWGSDGLATTASETDDGWRLDGVKSPVLAGGSADRILVLAGTPDGPSWFLVAGDATGLSRTRLTTIDPTRPMAKLTFVGTPARRLAGDALCALDRTLELAAVGLAAEQVGVIGQCLDMTVDYAKLRVQFSRPIGSYQAIKHGLADMYSLWEHALSVQRYAADVADHSPAELATAAALAQTFIGPAAFQVATKAVHFHGGIGYTWEHDAHLYYKRAKSAQLLLGPSAAHRTRLADQLALH
ncbi:acyl-CoA dehydrogenase family protein [Streptomyces sp. CA-100214]